MAFSSSQLSVRVGFDLTSTPKRFSLTDATDYSAESYSNILGLLRAVDPDGLQFYNNLDYNAPDIDISSSTSSGVLGSIPLGTNGLPKNGNYIFTYTSKILALRTSIAIVSNVPASNTLTLNGDQTAKILDPTAITFECVDLATTALTIVSATYNSGTNLTTVTIGETLPVLTSLAMLRFSVDTVFTQTFQEAYDYASPSVCISVDIDDCCSSVTLTDVTVYQTGATVTRLHTVSYPMGMTTPIADVTSPLQEFTISPIWTGTWTDIFTADIVATDGIIDITDAVRGVKSFLVASDTGICQAYECMTNMATKYAQYLTTAPAKAIEMSKYISQASAAYIAYSIGKKCGKADYEQYLSLITEIAASCGCGCDCDTCADGIPSQVVGCCENVGGSDYTIVVQSTGGSLTVTSNTVGDTTTFEISVTGAWFTSEFNSRFAAKSIDGLTDVNTGNIAAAGSQVLVWNNSLNRWERGLPTALGLTLNDLTNVDDTGLADGMLLYWDASTSTFKFKLVVANTYATLTDVVITSIQGGQLMEWNAATSKWNNFFLTLDAVTDVDIASRVPGSSIEWDNGAAKWVMFTPKKTLASLDDVEITGIANFDRLQYNQSGATKWNNVPIPVFSDTSVLYTAGYDGSVGTIFDFGYAIDYITNEVTIRGGIDNVAGTAVGSTVTLCQLPSGVRPASEVPFLCTVGYGAVNAVGFGRITSGGDIQIFFYIDPATGINAPGIPAGDIAFSTTIKYQKTP